MKRMYQIYDVEGGLVNGPIVLEHNDIVATRHFNTIFTNDNTMPQKFPEHFELRCLGVQDETNGVISLHLPHITVATGKAWLATEERRAIMSAIQEVK